jgi:hypothetical protein
MKTKMKKSLKIYIKHYIKHYSFNLFCIVDFLTKKYCSARINYRYLLAIIIHPETKLT